MPGSRTTAESDAGEQGHRRNWCRGAGPPQNLMPGSRTTAEPYTAVQLRQDGYPEWGGTTFSIIKKVKGEEIFLVLQTNGQSCKRFWFLTHSPSLPFAVNAFFCIGTAVTHTATFVNRWAILSVRNLRNLKQILFYSPLKANNGKAVWNTIALIWV